MKITISYINTTKMRRTLGCFISLTIMIFSPLLATTYYVDASSGNDLNNGISSETAWKTISKVNSYNFNPGDTILFKKGTTWRETLVIPSSGSSGNPITFGAYGTGDKPKILASVTKNSTGDWINESGNLWYVNASKRIYNVIMDSENVVATMVENKEDLDTQGKAWWDETNYRIYLYSTSNPATYYNGNIECAQQQMFIKVQGVSYIVIDDLDMRYSGHAGIYIYDNSDNITIQNCDINYTGSNQHGYVFPYGQGIHTRADHTTISNNTFYSNYKAIQVVPAPTGCVVAIQNNTISEATGKGEDADGICFSQSGDAKDCSGSVVSGNDISEFMDDGIDLYWAKNVIIEGNIIHDSKVGGEGKGIKCGGAPGSTGNQILRNHVYNINTGNQQGIVTNSSSDGKIAYNIVHDVKRGIVVAPLTASGGNNNWEIYNNVLFNCSEIGIHILKGIDGNNQLYATAQNNICDGQDYDLNCQEYSNVTGGYNCLINDAIVTGSGAYTGNANDLYLTNPLFIDASNNDFHLQLSSPCIEAGIDVGLTQDYDGNPVPHGGGVDIGACEYQAYDLFIWKNIKSPKLLEYCLFLIITILALTAYRKRQR